MEDLLLAILVVLAVAAVRQRDLLAATAVLGAYSLVMAALWAAMNALDVGFTEAAVGAGISTVLLLAALQRVGRREHGAGLGTLFPGVLRTHQERATLRAEAPHARSPSRVLAVVVCLAFAATLMYGAQDMPAVGDASSPANSNPEVAQRYVQRSADMPDGRKGEVGPANIVTSVLGDYRGYDTMGETIVIFTAALSVLLLLRRARPQRPGKGAP